MKDYFAERHLDNRLTSEEGRGEVRGGTGRERRWVLQEEKTAGSRWTTHGPPAKVNNPPDKSH